MISHRLRSADDGLLAEGLRKRVPHRVLSSPITLFARSLALARLMAQQDGARRHAGQRSLAVDFAKQEGAELIRIEDPRFARNGDRVKNRALIKGAVAQALKGKARAEWVENGDADPNVSQASQLPLGAAIARRAYRSDPRR